MVTITDINDDRSYMKRYLVFLFDEYYPLGGWTDFRGHFDTIEEAKDHILTYTPKYDHWQIVDSFHLRSILASWDRPKPNLQSK